MVSYLLLPYTIIVFSVEKQPCETYITKIKNIKHLYECMIL